MTAIFSSIRVVLATMAICVAGYTTLILGFAQIVTPATANGSLVTDAGGKVVGSALVAQDFKTSRYFWPRPSAVDYNGAGAGGSNKSPTNPELTERAEEAIGRYGATAAAPLPADLVTASGAGLDPHISLAGALYQVPRVADARGVPEAQVKALVEQNAVAPGGAFTEGRVVNVLMLNHQLDATAPAQP